MKYKRVVITRRDGPVQTDNTKSLKRNMKWLKQNSNEFLADWGSSCSF
jgi:hypothetical protein